jgi:hypothetical protein
VSPDDYGYWEIQDKATTTLAGFHGILPNMDMLHALLSRLAGQEKEHVGTSAGRRVDSGLEAAARRRSGSCIAPPTPGYGQGIPVGSIRSASHNSHSAMVTAARSADPVCPLPEVAA